MQSLGKVLLCLIVLMPTWSLAAKDGVDQHEHISSGIFPENDVKIYPNAKANYRINERLFKQAIGKVEDLFAHRISQLDAELRIEGSWRAPDVNAFAQQFVDYNGKKVFKVTVLGGIARHSAMTEDGLLTVLCHEMGHHLGGAPKYRSVWSGSQWASSEGQSDYYATAKCLRDVFSGDDNQAFIQKRKVPALVSTLCDSNFGHGSEESAICQRSSLAGRDVIKVLNDISGGFGPSPDFDTPDELVVSSTNYSYPSTQCRLDTLFSGAICKEDHRVPFSGRDPEVGACVASDQEIAGVRPRCWFAPQS